MIQSHAVRSQQWVDQQVQRLVAAGYREEQADPTIFLACVRRRDVQLMWSFTPLHTFVAFGRVEHATGAHVREFNALAARWAERAKGGMPRGFRSGSAVLPVLVCDTADESAREELDRRPPKSSALPELPMLVDLSQGRWTTSSRRAVRGGPYQDYLHHQQLLVAGNLRGEAPAGATSRTVVSIATSLVLGLGSLAAGLYFLSRLV